MSAELSERDKDQDKQERRERIRESRFNREYERCITEDVPVYLGRESTKERKVMARFRYWERRERERTGIGRKKKREGAGCAARRERRCGEMRERETKERKEILNEDGREIGWMKAIWKSRERIENSYFYIKCVKRVFFVHEKVFYTETKVEAV
jgi:hypothetical protein